MKLQSTEINRSVSEDSWKTHWEVDKTTGGQWWDAIRFHARMWNYKDYFFSRLLQEKYLLKKKALIEWLGTLYGDLWENLV